MNENLQMTTELFGNTLSRLTEMVVLGVAHIKIGRGLGKMINEDPAIAHVAPAFWGLSMTAHLDAAQLIAFKLFDTRRGTMTVEYLLNRAEELKSSFGNATAGQVEEVIKIARTQMASLHDPLKKIRAKRNRVLAHADPSIISSPEKLAKHVELTFSDLNIVFGLGGQILNEVSLGFRGASQVFELLGADDYEMAVSLIADAKCAQIRSYEAEFGRWDHLRPKKCP
jgi:hypothetical protein